MSRENDEVIENYRCRVIAECMCQVTKDVIWSHIKLWAYDKKPGMEFQVKVGRGKATHHSHKHGEPLHLITYGIEMVRSKHRPSEIYSWTTGKEILTRNYYDGRLSLLNALSHCCIHEAGHLVQVLLGRRYDGSVHNDEFYQILDRMHQNKVASMVRHELNIRARQRDVIISHIPLITQADLDAKQNLKAGVFVKTAYQGSEFIGVIKKVNPKSCVVTGINLWEGVEIKCFKNSLELIVDKVDNDEQDLLDIQI